MSSSKKRPFRPEEFSTPQTRHIRLTCCADTTLWFIVDFLDLSAGQARDGNDGAAVRGRIDWPRRCALMRHHTLLHIVNAVVLTRYGGLITGVQIGEEKSRIDFRLEGFDRDRVAELETRINEVIGRDLAVDAGVIDEAEFHARPELVRTAVVGPPVVDGRVRVVTIDGFDAQACGGTHVRSTGELGACTILRTENKGKNNKRLYLTLTTC